MKKLSLNEYMSLLYPFKCLRFGWVAVGFMLLSSLANAQCDIEVSGVLAYCNAVRGNGSFPGYFIGFRIKTIDGDTLDVVDLTGNVPTNRGKRINDINNEFEPSDTSRVRARIAGGADSLEYWYFGPFMDGDSFNIVLIDPDGICDTVEVASGTFTCAGQDPNACDANVPLYSLDFSQSQWQIGGGGGVNENVDQVFLVMQRSRVATCCQTGNERCFEFLITLDDDDIGLLIDDVGNGSTGGHIYADSLNGFACGTTQQNTWPWYQDNGQSADEPLCLSGSAREWIVLSCKQGNNVTGVSIGTVGELNIYPAYVYEDCTVQLEVLNASAASWSSDDDPNLDNLFNFTLDSLSGTFSYDEDTFGPVTSCDGDTFTYFIAGYPDNTCLGADSLLYDTTFVVVYPDFSIWIDSVCIGSDSISLNAILTSGAPNCGYSFIWSTGDTTQSIIVPDSAAQYSINVIREDLDSLVRDCSPATDIINLEDQAIVCLPDMLFECISEPPEDSIELIGIGGCGVNPLITSSDMSNNGSGCMLDSLIITRYYVVDYDGDTINTLTDRDTCIQLFIYVDDEPPVISCPPSITIGCTAPTSPESTGGYATAIDNCDSIPAITYSDAVVGGACPQEFIITRTWTATDVCGLTSTCNQIIAIEDNTPPAITCPPNITIQCSDSTLPSNTGTATANDICDTLVTPTYTDVFPAGACPRTIRRTWSATDDCGNSNTCLQIITIVDTEAPSATCPPDITISCSESTNPSNTGFATGIDNCDVALNISHSNSVAPGNCPQSLIITRTWSVSDDCGNLTTCVQIITTIDTIPPDLNCPADITIQCNTSTLPSQTGSGSATDNCDPNTPPSYSDVTIGGTCPHEHTILRTWITSDDCGNSSTCIQTIQVRDTTPPIVTCPPNVTIDCTENTLPDNTGYGAASDNCDPTVTPAYTDNITNEECPQAYTITRTWVATDDCGNTSMCIQIILVRDTTPPIVTCPSNITIDCTESTLPGNTGFASASDNCDLTVAPAFTDNIINGECPQEYTITRTWVATDDCGNSNTCIQTIQVRDTTPPLMTCPSNITIDCTESTLPGNTGFASASDNCDLTVDPAYTDIITDGDCPQEYTIARTWVATDDCGNSNTCIQTIHVRDTTPPEMACPSNITIDCTDDTLPGSTGLATATDNCDPTVSPEYTDTITNGTCPQEYTIARTWMATDDCGNINTCIQTIQVRDTTPPLITCPSNITIACTDDTLPVNTGIATATDNCDATVAPVNTDTITNGTCPQEYTIARTWVTTDDCGNSNICVQTILVRDTLPPVLACPSNITIDCTEDTLPDNTGYATATDNCDATVDPEYTDNITNGGCPQEYTITRTWVATDDCENAASCVQIINVVDQTAPLIACPADITINYTDSSLPANTGSATATDNCDTLTALSYNDELPSTCPALNIILRTWVAIDDCGNSSSCIQEILIEEDGNICGTVEDDLGEVLDSIEIQLIVDVNNNGIFDASDTLLYSVFTDTTGNYCFSDVKPCTYILREIQPLNYGDLFDYDFTADPDGNDSIDGPDNEIPVVLGQGENDNDNNFIDIVCPTILPVIPPDTICDGGVVVFETVPMNPGPLNYTWDFGSGSSPETAMGLGPHSVSYVTTTNNQISGAIISLTISKPGCPDLTGQVSTVEINPYPDPSINGSTGNLCYFTNRIFQPVAPEIAGATYNWSFGNNAVPLTATGYGPHTVYYTVSGPKTISLVIHPNEAGAQCPDSSTLTFNVVNCPGNITGSVKSLEGAGIQGVNLRLFADFNEDGIADNNTPIRSVFSTANGSYSMVGLTPASYVIVQTQPLFWSTVDDEDTSNDGDAVMNIDSLDNLIPATVNPNEIDAHNIFTEIPNPGTISGAVFIDQDGDETPDSGEGIGGVVIKLFEDNELDGLPDSTTPFDSVITTSAGNYSFTDIPIGNYVLEEIQPSGYESIQDIDATNDLDSVANVNQQDDLIPVTLANQEHDDHNYFIDGHECTLIVNSTNDDGPESLRFMVGCATGGDTIIFDSSLSGQTILLTSSKIEIDKDLTIISNCIPRITVSSSVAGLIDIGINRNVEIKGLDLISGIEGNNAAAFYNFGFLKLVDISLYRNPMLSPGELLIRNAFGSELMIEGFLNIYGN